MKKVYSIVVILLLMTSSLNTNASSLNAPTKNCFGVAAQAYDLIIQAGGDEIFAFEVSMFWFHDCLYNL